MKPYSLLVIPVGESGANENEKPFHHIPMQVPVYHVCGAVLAYCEQVPVVPAYALTIHRAQSLT